MGIGDLAARPECSASGNGNMPEIDLASHRQLFRVQTRLGEIQPSFWELPCLGNTLCSVSNEMRHRQVTQTPGCDGITCGRRAAPDGR